MVLSVTGFFRKFASSTLSWAVETRLSEGRIACRSPQSQCPAYSPARQDLTLRPQTAPQLTLRERFAKPAGDGFSNEGQNRLLAGDNFGSRTHAGGEFDDFTFHE